MFAARTLAEAQTYRSAHASTNLIYEIETIDPSPAIHLGDYSVAIEPHSGRYFEPAMQRAQSYWTETSPASPEVLIGGAVRVLARHD